MEQHVQLSDKVTLSSLQHAADCKDCYIKLGFGYNNSTAMELANDLVKEFQNGARVVWNTKD